MKDYGGRRDFRSPRWFLVMVVLCEILFATGAVAMYRMRGPHPMTLVAAFMAVFALGGIWEALVSRVELTDDALRITRLWGRRSYPRAAIVGVYSAKGTQTKVEVEKGKWVELPPVDHYPDNSIRSWLKARG